MSVALTGKLLLGPAVGISLWLKTDYVHIHTTVYINKYILHIAISARKRKRNLKKEKKNHIALKITYS